MKNVKKVLALMLALVMCMGIFAGCGDTLEDDVVESLSIPNIDESLAGKANADRYPLQCSKTFDIATREANPTEKELFMEWNNITGVDAAWNVLSGEQLSAAMASGHMPDAIFLSWGLSKEIIYEYGKANKLVNFAEYLEYMPNFQKMLAKYPDALDNFLNRDGSFYSLPSKTAGYGAPSNLLYVRRDMVRNAGLTMPKTIDEFKQFVLDLQAHYSDVEGFRAVNFLLGGEWGYIEWNGYMDNFFFPAFGNEALQTGYDMVDGKVVLGCTTEQYKRYLEFISWLYDSGACEQKIFDADANNRNGANVAADLNALFPAAKVNAGNFESGIVELDIMAPLTSQWQDKQIWTNSTSGWMLNCINAKLPEEDIITLVQWFDAFYADDTDPLNKEGTIYGNYLHRGEKDVHYKENADGTYELIYKGDWETVDEWIASEASSAVLYSMYDHGIRGGNTYFFCKQVGVRDNLWPHMVERWSPTMLFLTEDESYDSTDVNTDLNLYMESAFAKFMTGAWTVEDNWTEYMAGLESIGALDLVETYQNAYDRNK